MTNYFKPGYAPGKIKVSKSEPMEFKITWIPFSKESPPKGKHGDKKYIFLLVDNVPIVLAYWGEEFIPTKGMTHWFPIPEVPK